MIIYQSYRNDMAQQIRYDVYMAWIARPDKHGMAEAAGREGEQR